jgi:hypothetical protein
MPKFRHFRQGVKGFAHIPINTTGLLDSDALAFLTSASITNSTQRAAINKLVIDLKSFGIWNKMFAIYPFIGGTADSHKWNLKDPRDLNAAFRLTFSGGWTHSETGILPNGTNAFADTFFNIINSFPSTTDVSMGCYIRTGNSSQGVDMGAGTTTSVGNGILIYSSFSGTILYGNALGATSINNGVSNTNSQGFYCVTRSGTVHSQHKRGNITIDNQETEAVSSNLPNLTIYIGAGNPAGGTGQYIYSNRQHSFSFIGTYLSQLEITNFYNCVQTYQTSLSRAV